MNKPKRKKVSNDDTVIFIKNVPKELKTFFKAHCAKRNTTMSSSILNHMRKTIEKDSGEY